LTWNHGLRDVYTLFTKYYQCPKKTVILATAQTTYRKCIRENRWRIKNLHIVSLSAVSWKLLPLS